MGGGRMVGGDGRVEDGRVGGWEGVGRMGRMERRMKRDERVGRTRGWEDGKVVEWEGGRMRG